MSFHIVSAGIWREGEGRGEEEKEVKEEEGKSKEPKPFCHADLVKHMTN